MKERYSTYKSSGVEWIGEIPKHWETIKLKHLTTIKRGSSPRPIDDPKFFDDESGEYYWVRISDVSRSDRYLYYTEQKMSELGSSLSHKLGEDEVIMSISGSVGKVMITKTKCCIHDGFITFQNPKMEKLFLFYLLTNSEIFKEDGKVGTQTNINSDIVCNKKVPTPPLPEQEQIVKYLDEKTSQIDGLISITEKKIELLKQKRTSLINEVVTKGLNPDVELKDSGVEWIGEIPIHWDRTTIKRLVTTKLTDGPHLTPNFVDEGVPFISVESIKDDKIDFEYKRGFITKEDDIEFSKKCKPKRDDILFVKSGSTTGKVTIVDTDLDFNVWSPLCLIRPNTHKVSPRFVFHSMKSDFFQLSVQQSWSFGTQPNIGMGVIENLYLIVPPLSEQEQIVDFIDTHTTEIDRLVSIEHRRIERLKEYRQNLISEVVTGKIKVTD